MSSADLHTFLAQTARYLALAAPYTAAAALFFALVALVLVLLLRRRLVRLALGKNGSIEETVTMLSSDLKELHAFRAELEKYLKLAESRMQGSVSGVGVVRFNPFHKDGSGGNQSFAIALLDEKHDGVVLSTLYARDRVGVYAKPLESGASTFALSDEEREAVEKAKHSVAEHKRV